MPSLVVSRCKSQASGKNLEIDCQTDFQVLLSVFAKKKKVLPFFLCSSSYRIFGFGFTTEFSRIQYNRDYGAVGVWDVPTIFSDTFNPIPNICIKYSKHGITSTSFSYIKDFIHSAYFQKLHFEARIELFLTFMLINFLIRVLHCQKL